MNRTYTEKQINTLNLFIHFHLQGVLVSAIRNGWWILLDEINLATAETLQCLSSLLEGPQGSFLITEQWYRMVVM